MSAYDTFTGAGGIGATIIRAAAAPADAGTTDAVVDWTNRLSTLGYIAAAILFIMALAGLSKYFFEATSMP